MPTKIKSCYDQEALCQDIARSDLSIKDIATKYKVSIALVYQIAAGTTRPELKVRIDELIQAEKGAGMRLARSRGRWFVGRLIQLAALESDVGLEAILKGLEVSGIDVAAETSGEEKQTIEVIFSAKQGEEGKEPLAPRLTGVYNGNN